MVCLSHLARGGGVTYEGSSLQIVCLIVTKTIHKLCDLFDDGFFFINCFVTPIPCCVVILPIFFVFLLCVMLSF